MLFYPTAIGWHPAEKEEFGAAQYEAWQTMQRAHAIANGVYVAAVNRVGMENGDVRGNRVEGPGMEFWGGSFIADPFGRIIAKASHDREEILIGEIDPKSLEESAATGRSCATAASTRTRRSHIAFSIDRWIEFGREVRAAQAVTDATRRELGLSHAGRVGAARGHLDRLAARCRATGREAFKAIPWVYADIVRHLSRVEQVHILVQNATRKNARAAC